MQAAQVLLTFFDISAREQYVNARRTLAKLLEWEVVPVINENDTTATDEISFGDNDILAAQVAILMSADLLVVLSDVDGALHERPEQRLRRAQLVREVHDLAELRQYEIGMSSSHLGSGGMRSKVLCAEMATSAGHPGRDLQRHRAGNAGAGGRAASRWAPASTPRRGAQSSFKLWLQVREGARAGRCSSTPGAERALREQGTSLLPVGVVEVEGDFEAGDAVEVAAAADGRAADRQGDLQLLGGGAAPVKGLKSAQVREVLPRASEEAVHRDYFVLA